MRTVGGPARSMIAKIDDAVARVLQVLVGVIMIAAVLINFANVAARYAFLRPFIWAEESMQFLNVWGVMLGAAVITRNGAHLKMDALYGILSPRSRQVLDGLANVLNLIVSVYVIVQSATMIRMLRATGQRSVIAGVPMNLMYLAIPLGFGCGVLFLVLGFLEIGRAHV